MPNNILAVDSYLTLAPTETIDHFFMFKLNFGENILHTERPFLAVDLSSKTFYVARQVTCLCLNDWSYM